MLWGGSSANARITGERPSDWTSTDQLQRLHRTLKRMLRLRLQRITVHMLTERRRQCQSSKCYPQAEAFHPRVIKASSDTRLLLQTKWFSSKTVQLVSRCCSKECASRPPCVYVVYTTSKGDLLFKKQRTILPAVWPCKLCTRRQ
jgi:hypothetical protein